MDIKIDNKEYEFMLYHTHIAEDLIDNIKVIEFIKKNNYYINEKMVFLKDYYRKIDKIDTLRPCAMYYFKKEKIILFNISNIKLDNEIEACILGEYLHADKKLIDYFLNLEKIYVKI